MSDPNAALIDRIAKGDKGALADLYRALERPVYRFILSRLNDPHEAADILQDVFIDIWRAAARFEGRAKVQTWVFGIAHRKTIDALRRKGRIDLTDTMPDEADDGPDMATCLVAAEEAGHVRHCLGTLSDDHRAVVSLTFYDDMSAPEISRVIDAPEGTVRSRLHHAKRLLMRCLEGRMGRPA
ncbi:sigma-70 family RNA polymerase sigma factor [Roseibacterium sp. SDUM158017]|uniref:RNA polymerase sigma factor n=1 Tax=Roseicyclus salinarum TaxID=3036773 RepID=UPI0024153B59|nr:sigma-70 family RNA polymerase sigma factor [Roseibacterium sp. SDUM158017]MDG4647368.1 sigma-70 family RNA polymerase sigma factor [Roseibacterium sp. SDUM158017]